MALPPQNVHGLCGTHVDGRRWARGALLKRFLQDLALGLSPGTFCGCPQHHDGPHPSADTGGAGGVGKPFLRREAQELHQELLPLPEHQAPGTRLALTDRGEGRDRQAGSGHTEGTGLW